MNLTGFSSGVLSGYRLDTSAPSALALFSVAPPTLGLTALGGNVSTFTDAEGALLMFPSATGDLKIFAAGDINFGAGTSVSRITMADTGVDAWPTAANPLSNTPTFIATMRSLRASSPAARSARPGARRSTCPRRHGSAPGWTSTS